MFNEEQREKFRAMLRALRPWVSPRSYRPLVLLFAVSMGVFFGPLAVDVWLAILGALPFWFRWSVGELSLLVCIGLGFRRIWHIKPTDCWPGDPDVLASASDTGTARLLPWALRLAVVPLALAILQHPHGLGFADWDFVLDKFEALRRTVLVWGQFPWWNPWCRGGFPLAAEPQIGAVSIATPLVLAFGSTIGLGLAAILYLVIALEGAYRLAWLWFGEPWSSAAVALIYGLNGGVIINTAQGYVLAMSYGSLPWLAYFAFKIDRRFSDGLWLGFWLAFSVLSGIQYLSFYGGLLAALIWLRALRLQTPGRRLRLLAHTLAAVGACFALCGWRLATVFLVLLDDRRETVTYWDQPLLGIVNQLLERPEPDWVTALPGRFHAGYIELVSYVGPLVVVLGLVSLAAGWRWWHTLAALCTWLALGSVQWYHPSKWLSSWPLFASAHVVTRWRFVALLGWGMAAGSVLARWRGSATPVRRVLAVVFVLVIACDLVCLGYEQLPLAFSIPPEPRYFPGPPVPEIINVRDGKGFPCVSRGYGVIRGYEPMLSYYREAPTLRKFREAPDYRGESWTDAGAVRPIFWSPNRIVFQVEPGQAVYVNQNPGSWWWANGRRAFGGLRCAELTVPFVARADDQGRLELRIHPRGLSFGIWLHVLGVALLVALLWCRRAIEELPSRTDKSQRS